jgi:hypothetical protein
MLKSYRGGELSVNEPKWATGDGAMHKRTIICYHLSDLPIADLRLNTTCHKRRPGCYTGLPVIYPVIDPPNKLSVAFE